jgi:hypothetical protein
MGDLLTTRLKKMQGLNGWKTVCGCVSNKKYHIFFRRMLAETNNWCRFAHAFNEKHDTISEFGCCR